MTVFTLILQKLDIESILQEPVYVFERTSTLKVLDMLRTQAAITNTEQVTITRTPTS
jgi:hypothetical protein